LSSSHATYSTQQASKTAACVTDSICTAASFASFRLRLDPRSCTPVSVSNPISISTKSVNSLAWPGLPALQCSTKGRSATSRRLSPDLHLGGSQRVRVPEYAAPQPSSSRRHRPRQPPHISTLTTKTRHCTPHSPSRLTTPLWLADHHRLSHPALHHLNSARSCSLRPTSRNAEHPNTLQSASRQR
jgi:hypothetical protein